MAMRRRTRLSLRVRELLSLTSSYYSSLHSPFTHHYPPLPKLLPSPLTFSSSSSSSSSFDAVNNNNNNTPLPSKSRDSIILEQFWQRKLKGSSSLSSSSTTTTSNNIIIIPPDDDDEKKKKKKKKKKKVAKASESNETTSVEEVGGFKELGVNDELVEVLEEIGVFLPTEIHCVAIPTILHGNSVLLSSPSAPHNSLAFLLPLIQFLRRDIELLGSSSDHPRAIVLCATEEKAEQCFNAAKYIIHKAMSKSAKGSASADNKLSNTSIGLIIGTPSEILQYIEEGSVVPAELRYLVLNDVDDMLRSGLGPEIHKILRPLLDHESKSNNVTRLQTVLTISAITEVLGEQSPIVKNFERDHAGNVSAMSLEMDQTEVFHFVESLDALRKKMAEAMDSLLK